MGCRDEDTAQRLKHRKEVLIQFGAEEALLGELLEYTSNAYKSTEYNKMNFPLEDEGFVPVWEGYQKESALRGVFEVLKEKLVQLSFPIEKEISQTELYRNATLRGLPIERTNKEPGLGIVHQDTMELLFASCPAGRLPVLLVHNKPDFVSVIRALGFRNEPEPIPESMGSLIIAGYNNWDRVRIYREEWQDSHPDGEWEEEMGRLAQKKELYQDKFIILSDSPYSAVKAEVLQLENHEWKNLSYKIRIGHELSHYFCKKVFSSMRNNILDEILADYVGIIYACGRYRSDWFLHFMGIEEGAEYKKGGRMENYTRGLSDEAFGVICRLVRAAASNLEQFDADLDKRQDEPYKVLTALSFFTVEELATEPAVNRLKEMYGEVRQNWRIKS